MSETCEHIRSFHGRDWTSERSEEAVKARNIPKLIQQSEGKFEGTDYDVARKKRENIFDLIQAYFLFLQFEGAVNLDEVEAVCSSGQDRYGYMKKKQLALESTIKSFRNDS